MVILFVFKINLKYKKKFIRNGGTQPFGVEITNKFAKIMTDQKDCKKILHA